MKPPNSSLPTRATALNLETVAMLPLSKYLNGARCAGSSRSFSARLMHFVAYFAPWIAPCAIPGTPGTAIRSPTTKTFGCPLTVRSG
ncbi:hypothetical protein MYXE_44310 [Mycobacterium xenopi]|uniref:Uncharacterized protein n=1 Tax=Mycobacterium xenopi TaxID=1789 RepID=A0AAD1H5A2_MYCXE|nr:hypothetical protein MYXE_44310 [Mycobacterium xenopi]